MTLHSKKAGTRYAAAEWRRRVDLAACYRLADLFGFSDIVWNHITARIPGTDHILINRLGLRFDEVTASNLVAIDLDGNVVDPGNGESEEAVNVTGFVIHSAIHRARPDIHCVMHSHSRAGMAVSALRDGLVPMTIDAMPFHGRVGYHAFEGMSVELDERERLAADLGGHKAMILRNHGLLTCGESVAEAFMLMYYLERACTVQLEVLASGAAVSLPAADICERTAAQSDRFPQGHYEWPALLRLADARSPGFRD